jgi:predicted TIM-barrel fold metal-dependent hydrolase
VPAWSVCGVLLLKIGSQWSQYAVAVNAFVEPKVDAHCHVLDPLRFPYAADVAYRPAGAEIGTVDQYLEVMAAYGIAQALLVGPNSGYRYDNRCLLDALACGAGRFQGIAVVRYETSRDALLALREQGVVGVALNATVMGVEHCLGAAPLLRELATLDMLLSLQVEHDQLVALRPLVEDSGVRTLIGHCGRPAADAGLQQPGFQALLAMARNGRTAVKLSGWQKFSRQRAPWDDTRAFADALLDAFTPDACLWASDWPFLRAPERLDIGPLLRMAERLLPRAVDRRRVFWETPMRWLGFESLPTIGP